VMADILYGFGSESPLAAEVSEYITQYHYRKIFGLSWTEYMEEPYNIFLINSMIHIISGQVKESRMKQ
jgi:hypothetical protein